MIDADGPLSARVAVVESLGHERHVACELAGGALWIALVPARGACPSAGDPVRLRARPERMQLFDGASGWRIDVNAG